MSFSTRRPWTPARYYRASLLILVAVSMIYMLASTSRCSVDPSSPLCSWAAASIDGSPSSDALTLIVLGDWGGQNDPPFTTEAQLAVAEAMRTVSLKRRPRGIISVGDHFYLSGINSTSDPRIEQTFENVYKGPGLDGLPWYLVAGNHDADPDEGTVRLDAQIAYTNVSKRWNFPARYFTHEFTISGARKALFVFLETNALCTEEALDGEQLAWLKKTLEESSHYHAVFVVGHHPPYSHGGNHGPTLCMEYAQVGFTEMLRTHGVATYFAGHDHHLEHLQLPQSDSVAFDFFISGAGSATVPYAPHDQAAKSLFFYPKDDVWVEAESVDGAALQELDIVDRIAKHATSTHNPKVRTDVMNPKPNRDRKLLPRVFGSARGASERSEAASKQSEQQIHLLHESQPEARRLGLEKKIWEGLNKLDKNGRLGGEITQEGRRADFAQEGRTGFRSDDHAGRPHGDDRAVRPQGGVDMDSRGSAAHLSKGTEIAQGVNRNDNSAQEGLYDDPRSNRPSVKGSRADSHSGGVLEGRITGSVEEGRAYSHSNALDPQEGRRATSIHEVRRATSTHEGRMGSFSGRGRRPQEGSERKHRRGLLSEVSEDGADGHDRTMGGFLVLEVDGEKMKVDFYDHNAREIYSYQTALPARNS